MLPPPPPADPPPNWLDLPDELLLLVLARTAPETRQSAAPQVCRAWRDLLACPTTAPILHASVTIDGRPPDDDAAADDGGSVRGGVGGAPVARLAAGPLLAWLEKKAHAIRHLHAAHTLLPPDAWHAALTTLAPRLRDLDLTGDTARSVPWRALPRGLRALRVTECDGALDARAHLAHLPPSLTALHLLAAGAPDGGLRRSGRPFLDGFPRDVLRLRRLADLALASRGVRFLPPDLAALTALTRLSVRHAGLVTLPDAVGDLPRLAALDLAGNKLLRSRGARAALAPLARLAPSLTSLDLSSNASQADETELPGCVLGALTRLVELRAAHNTRLAVPAALSKLSSLALLDLRSCDLADYPPALADLRGVASLLLGGNRRIAAGGLPSSAALADLDVVGSPPSPDAASPRAPASPGASTPRCCTDCASASPSPPSSSSASPSPPSSSSTSLAAAAAALSAHRARAGLPALPTPPRPTPTTTTTALPPPPPRTAVGQLVRVRELDLSRSGLASLPPSATALTALTSLCLRGASAYPGVGFDWASLARVPRLRSLDVSGAYLEELPAALAALPALRSLRACECGLVRVGPVAAALTSLTSLALDGNRLALLPAAELAAMPRLETASLVDNVGMELPADLGALARARSLVRLDARKHARGVGGRAPPWSTASMWRLARAFPALAGAAPGRDWSAVLLL